jgi:hypothetical protein
MVAVGHAGVLPVQDHTIRGDKAFAVGMGSHSGTAGQPCPRLQAIAD